MNWDIINDDVVDWANKYTGPKFHALLTDPPYELGFMGKHWDKSGVSFDPKTWKDLACHLLPGAMLLSFGACRNYHRLACAIEDAGLEIRDSLIVWLNGQSFPKSLNLAKAIEASGASCDNKTLAGYGTAIKSSYEPVVMARKPLEGTEIGRAHV